MSKQNQGSKKKGRKKAFLEREKRREEEKLKWKNISEAKTIEEAAKAMGVKLK